MTTVTVTHVLLVGAGGAAGSIARFLLSSAVHKHLATTLPYGTLAVNALGCAAIGLVAGYAGAREVLTPALRAFLLIGILGGFTTFSAFGLETHALLRDGHPLQAGANVVMTLVLCLGAVWLGHQLGHQFGHQAGHQIGPGP